MYCITIIVYNCSSMLTVPLGAALTADSVFSDEPAERADFEHATSYGTEKPRGVDNPNFQVD